MNQSEQLNDAQIIEQMQASISINEWNTKREGVKSIRSTAWIAEHIDASGIIDKSNIPKDVPPIQQVN